MALTQSDPPRSKWDKYPGLFGITLVLTEFLSDFHIFQPSEMRFLRISLSYRSYSKSVLFVRLPAPAWLAPHLVHLHGGFELRCYRKTETGRGAVVQVVTSRD